MEKNYCMYCKILQEEPSSHCSDCGQKLEVPQEKDPILLCKANAMIANLLEPLLQAENIPYAKQSKMGAAAVLRAGDFLEEYSFYVPYMAMEKVSQIPPVWENY